MVDGSGDGMHDTRARPYAVLAPLVLNCTSAAAWLMAVIPTRGGNPRQVEHTKSGLEFIYNHEERSV